MGLDTYIYWSYPEAWQLFLIKKHPLPTLHPIYYSRKHYSLVDELKIMIGAKKACTTCGCKCNAVEKDINGVPIKLTKEMIERLNLYSPYEEFEQIPDAKIERKRQFMLNQLDAGMIIYAYSDW